MKLFRSMRRCGKGVLALLFCWSVTAGAEAVDFMPVESVHTGMEGYAKTVVEGDTITSFNVKVLGVMKDRGPSGDLILAKFSGPVIDSTGGIVHGMSGSPVYLNGKLAGAVAYGWGFADGTIGMITPIADMVSLWNIPYETQKSNPWRDERLIPLGTPLMAYGFDKASLEYMKSKLPEYGYTTYDTAAADGDGKAKPLEAGGSVAALLVSGDMKLGAIGTVTYVDQNRIVAFGHPFLKRGSVDYFMHNAHIFTVVKSVDSGFKLGSMGAEVGSVTEDRGAGIAGTEGVAAKGIPMTVDIRDLDTGKSRRSVVKIIEADEMTPALAASSLYSLLNKTIDRSGEGTATVEVKITPRDISIEPLQRRNMFYSSEAITLKGVDEFYNLLDVLMNNRFRDYEIADITVKADITKDTKTAVISDATLSQGVASPGDTVAVNVTLQPFRGEPVTKEIFYTIPKDQPLGPATLEVRGGGVVPLPYLLEKQRYNLTDEIIRRLKTYKDFKEFYHELLHTDTNNQLVVEILQDGVSMVDDGESKDGYKAKIEDVEESSLPGAIKKTKVPTDVADVLHDDKEPREAKIDTEYVVRGDGQFTLQIASPAERDKLLSKRKKEQQKLLLKAVAEAANKQESAIDTVAATKESHEDKEQ